MTLIKRRSDQQAPSSGLEEFRARIKLDRHALDLAAEEQPELFLQVADEHVLATSRQDQARDELLRIDARLGREVREKLAADPKAKITEGAVADYVLKEQEHLDAADKLSTAKREVDEWGALRSALEHRKSMIRELALLYSAGYYTVGAAGGAGRSVRDTDAAVNRRLLAEGRARGEARGS